MVGILNLRIYTPDKLFPEEVITKLSINGKEGNYTILPNHVDYLSSFNNSNVSFEKQNKEKSYLWLNQGVLVKCGREIQISTFSAINNGNVKLDIKKMVSNTKKDINSLIGFDRKFKNTLKNIEKEIFKIKNNRNYR